LGALARDLAANPSQRIHLPSFAGDSEEFVDLGRRGVVKQVRFDNAVKTKHFDPASEIGLKEADSIRRPRAPGKACLRIPRTQPRGTVHQALVAQSLAETEQKLKGDFDALQELSAEKEEPISKIPKPTKRANQTIQWTGVRTSTGWKAIDHAGRTERVKLWFWFSFTAVIRLFLSLLFMNDYIRHALFNDIFELFGTLFFILLSPSLLSIEIAYQLASFMRLIVTCYCVYTCWISIFSYKDLMYTHSYTLYGDRREQDWATDDNRPMTLRGVDPLYESNDILCQYSLSLSSEYALVPLHFYGLRLVMPWFHPNPEDTAKFNSSFHIDLEIMSHAYNVRTSHPSLYGDLSLLTEKVQRSVTSLTAVNVSRDTSLFQSNVSSNTVLVTVAKILQDLDAVRACSGFQVAGSYSDS
jgi:hypothetical protein